MDRPMLTKAKHALRNTFLTGLFITLPLAVTIVVIRFVFNGVDGIFSPLITRLLILFGAHLEPEYRIPGIGVVVTVSLIFAVGIITKYYAGRKMIAMGESLIVKIPGLKGIYSASKQMIETFSNGGMAFKKVAMIEYPRKGIYTIVFITNTGKSEISARAGKDVVNVFIPTTPNPTSGFFLALPKEDVTELDMSVEDGFKLIISGGMFVPPHGANGQPDQPGGI